MNEDIKPFITIYDDFYKNSNKINAWTDSECFPIANIKNKAVYDKYTIIEITFPGTHGDNNFFNERAQAFYSFLKKFLSVSRKQNFVFAASKKEIKNRIRSYKGLFSKSISSEKIIYKEFDIDNSYSIIEGIVKLEDENIDIIKGMLFDRESCFVILSDENLLSETILDNLYLNLSNKKTYVINYLELCLHYCKNENLIIREMGDGGDQEFSWQIFIEKKQLSNIIFKIENILQND